MLASFLGRKFSTKCKQLMKPMKVRITMIRNRKGAMLKILKKDVADLLANGHDANALVRMDALILEMNKLSCYDMIDHFCDHIMSRLSFLEKKRDCPEDDDREAVATLIFAAARFPDLPELIGLRQTFIERYGTSVEAPVNQQILEKTSTKSFSKDRKLRVMQEISQEFNVPWNANSFKQTLNQKKHNPSSKPELHRRLDAPLSDLNGESPDVKHSVSKNVHTISDSNRGLRNTPIVQDRHMRELEINRHDDKPRSAFSETPTKQENTTAAIDLRNSPTVQDRHMKELEINRSSRKPGLPFSRTATKQEDKTTAMDLIPPPYVKAKERNDNAAANVSKNLIPPPYVKSNSKKNGDVVDSNKIEPRRRFTAAAESIIQDRSTANRQELGNTSDKRPKPTSVRRTHSKLKNVAVADKFKAPIEDDDDEMMDKLLKHYSGKGMVHRKSNSWAQGKSSDDQNIDSNGPEMQRSATTSRNAMEPDRSSPLVHPRLPDYDEIAARFNALKRKN